MFQIYQHDRSLYMRAHAVHKHRIARPRIIFFPGLGTDERLLQPQRALPLDLDVPRWLEPLSERESLETM
jgi:hypothetical protein